MTPNKRTFMEELGKAIKAHYAKPGTEGTMPGWAHDSVKLHNFLQKTAETLLGEKNLVSIDGQAFVDAWRAIGMKGKPTFKGLRAL